MNPMRSKTLLLATTVLALGTGVAVAQSVITPGGGSLTDVAGNTWLITSDGSVQKNGQWTPGGGDTAALTIANGTVYGEDATGKGWFTLSGQSWTPSAAPAGVASTSPAAATITPATTTPAVAPVSVCATPGGAASGSFATSNGQIIGPNGQPFIARGIDVMYGNGNPSAAQLQADFPGVNFVRLAIYNYDSPASLSAYVDSLTSAGIVVELENHNNNAGNAGGGGGTIFTGAALAQEQAWYSSVASAFASNPYVWFGTNNEPSEVDSSGQTDPAALSAWQQTTYNTIRAAGNNSPVMLEANSFGPGQTNTGYVASDYAAMTNVVWDLHYYGWVSGYSTNQSTVSSTLASMIAGTQAIQSANGQIPVLIGEYGNSTSGTSIDPNANQVITAVQQSGVGSAAWAWGTGNPGDGLTNSDGSVSANGQQVAAYTSGAPSVTPNAPACPAAAVALPQAQVVHTPQAQTIAPPPPPPPTPTLSYAPQPALAAAPTPTLTTPPASEFSGPPIVPRFTLPKEPVVTANPPIDTSAYTTTTE